MVTSFVSVSPLGVLLSLFVYTVGLSFLVVYRVVSREADLSFKSFYFLQFNLFLNFLIDCGGVLLLGLGRSFVHPTTVPEAVFLLLSTLAKVSFLKALLASALLTLGLRSPRTYLFSRVFSGLLLGIAFVASTLEVLNCWGVADLSWSTAEPLRQGIYALILFASAVVVVSGFTPKNRTQEHPSLTGSRSWFVGSVASLALIVVVQALTVVGLPQQWAEVATVALLMVFFVLEGVGMTALCLQLFAAVKRQDTVREVASAETLESRFARYGLSRRETDICQLLNQGLVLKVIAGRLGISVHTARNHCQNIYRKVGVTTRVELLHRITAP